MKFEGKTFSGEEIDLDFNSFKGCTFIKCKMNFRGFGPVELGECNFENVKWNFSSPVPTVKCFKFAEILIIAF